ncbi:MAG: class I SAM-dependent RNA methyltransferase [Elusimicrobia bacterium]|nr:class I SAM-dependent RNA methyltransferase [Elusimicrobiota bacterium]
MERCLAVCGPGLESFVADELRRLGLAPPTHTRPPAGGASRSGAVEFAGSLHDVQRANLRLRCADRVLVRLGEFYASAFPELRRKASRLPWERFLSPGRPVAFRVDCRRSRLYHEGAVAERLAGAIADRTAKPPLVLKPREDADSDLPQLIVVRLEDNLCAISLDSSGALLHRRGYRLATAKAPLRETLACAMLEASGWDGTAPFLDPFCGSGTIAIEAARSAQGIHPSLSRRFAFMEWPGFDRKSWERLLADAGRAAVSPQARIIASDRDAGAIQAAQENAHRAGVGDRIEFSCRAFSAIEPPLGAGFVVTNPPYGVRLSAGKDLRDLYAQLGKVLRARCQGWRLTLLCADSRLLRHTGWEFDRQASTINGGLKVGLLSCRV